MIFGAPSFSKGTVSSVVLFTYILFLFLVFWEDVLPDVPKDQEGLNIQDAYIDLHRISERPHPYNSHANDYVREYILSKVHSIEDEHSHVRVVDDLRSNGSWASNYGVYFEGTNILVKIDGTNPDYRDNGGVLFSAHYDSVSTAPGATDDGMGVATILQLIRYFATHRIERTAVFNINNGEEDWLNGAHAFLRHPWSRIPDSFLNLEGAASGGRPLLFRATSSAVLRAFRSRNVPRPHANVLSADAFKSGAIRSGTDYSVYTEAAGMQGLDLAFYKGRSKYHTKYDAVPYTDGHEKSLWAMMEAARGAGNALLNDPKIHDPDRYVPAVYFDLFASRLVLFPLNSLYIFNILFLILGPIFLIGLLFIEAVIKAANRRTQEHQAAHGPSLLTRVFTDFHLMWRWSKFWVAIIVTIGIQALLVSILIAANPYIIYSNPYIVLFCLTAVSFITFTWTITSDLPPSPYDDPAGSLPKNQKETILLQSYFLSWILLLLSTIAIGKAGIGGSYPIPFWSLGLWLACALRSIETVFSVKNPQRGFTPLRSRSRSSSRSSSYEHRRRDEPSERTPLNQEIDNEHGGYTENSDGQRGRGASRKFEDEGRIDWWLLQFIFVVPAPVIMVAHMANIILDATSQTLTDGNSKVTVYASASLIGFFLVLPLAPFSFQVHRSVGSMLLLLFVIFGLWATLWSFPFDANTPLKIYFQQTVQLEGAVGSRSLLPNSPNPGFSAALSVNGAGDSSAPIIRDVVTSLYGAPEYLRSDVVPTLPSAQGKQVECSRSHVKPGLTGCNWPSGNDMIPQPGSAPERVTTFSGVNTTSPSLYPDTFGSTNFFHAELLRTSSTSARITIQGRNTRNCRLYFSNRAIIKYTVQNDVHDIQPSYAIQDPGITELRLWSRGWDKQFVVDVEWRDYIGLGEGLKGKVACEWAEYASASASVPGQGEDPAKGGFRSAKIPALEEVLSFLPAWVAVSKFADGLVEAWEYFEV